MAVGAVFYAALASHEENAVFYPRGAPLFTCLIWIYATVWFVFNDFLKVEEPCRLTEVRVAIPNSERSENTS